MASDGSGGGGGCDEVARGWRGRRGEESDDE